ncbi:hypothetical protein ILUMI_20033 [Ignelater luminosus]|uniref:Pacifastin domain-containing protein n=1 Tax=Ignelater luminosus TaxID=2038154 RepID=A0A8K0FZB0_IGNLU|nr:hypothetical protein ILUMI_20033 [Ignelater luminosus]
MKFNYVGELATIKLLNAFNCNFTSLFEITMKFILFVPVCLVLVECLRSCAYRKRRFGKTLCRKGETYVENECNFCLCRAGVIGICTTMTCEWAQSLKACKVGTRWMKKCNRCWCIKNVGQVCEHHNCGGI